MATQTVTRTKICCKCGRDVSIGRRMKDSAGRYWCIPCGETDQRHRASVMGGICAGCGESYSASQMTELGGMPYCDKCLKKRYKGKGTSRFSTLGLKGLIPALSATGGGGGRMRMMLILIGVLVLLSLAINFWIL